MGITTLMDSFPKLPLFIGGIFMNLCDESKSGKVWTLGPTFHGVGAFWRQEEFAVVLSQSDGVALASVPGSVERIDGDERLRKVMGHGNLLGDPKVVVKDNFIQIQLSLHDRDSRHKFLCWLPHIIINHPVRDIKSRRSNTPPERMTRCAHPE